MKAVLAGVAGAAAGLVVGAASGLGIGMVVGSGAQYAADCGISVSQGQSSGTVEQTAISSGGLGRKTVTNGGPDQEAIYQEVVAHTGTAPGAQQQLLVTMLTGSDLESGWDAHAPTDDGGFGAFRIQMPGVTHTDITVAQALDIPYATAYMYPVYLAASQREEVQSRWASGDYAGAAEANAFYAEKPHDPYHVAQGQAKVNEAFNAAVALMQAHGITPNFSAQSQDPTDQAKLAQQVTRLSNDTCRTGGTTSSRDTATLVAFSGATGAAQKVLDAATAQIGLPYSWGGGDLNGPTYGSCDASNGAPNDCRVKGFDCSGLTRYSYAQAGVTLPRTAAAQWQATRSRTVVPHGGDLAKAQAGDLVFFTGYTDSFNSPGHVGIYMGDGKMINAPESGENIKITDITTPGWQDDLVGITDPFGLSA